MKYAEGGELYSLLRRHRTFSEAQACFYAAEVVIALEYLHGRGIVHGDLKLENILLGADGHVLLSDFGLARPYDKTSVFQSTPEYMAPEQLIGKDSRFGVDLWALVN